MIIWNMAEDKSLSEPWIGVTRFAPLNKNPPDGHMWVQGRLTKKRVTTTRSNICPEWSNMSKGAQRKATNNWAEEEPTFWTRQENNEAFTTVRTMILTVKKS